MTPSPSKTTRDWLRNAVEANRREFESWPKWKQDAYRLKARDTDSEGGK